MNYARFQTIAKTQLTKYGQPVVFHVKSNGGYDPISGTVVEEAVTDIQAMAVLAAPSYKAIQSGLVHAGDAALLVQGDIESPSERDTVTVAGEEWSIIRVQKVAPADLVILYKIYIRRV